MADQGITAEQMKEIFGKWNRAGNQDIETLLWQVVAADRAAFKPKTSLDYFIEDVEAADIRDAARFDFLCDPKEARFIEESDGLWRVYRDLGAERRDWRAMTMKFYPSAREAIDAAMPCMPSAMKGEQP